MTSTKRAKPFEVSKREVFDAWKRVKANKGAGGVDRVSIATFEAKLSKNLYKLWNRMSSGSYFPKAVKRVEIPKKDGSKRPLGIPTIYDRVAQEVVRVRLESELEPLFHDDSYGYRPGKSAIDAVEICRRRNWEYDWVLDVDIQKFFDTIDHELLLKAVNKHCSERWMVLYIERWLQAPVQYPDGEVEQSSSGTPQGGVISPLLANLYLHYAFDNWMDREYPSVKFERYADDAIIHCRSKLESAQMREALRQRLAECGLQLHPEKTNIVYCKDYKRSCRYPDVSYTFLGYTFRPRRAKGRSGNAFTVFVPAVSREAQKHIRGKVKAMKLQRRTHLSIQELAKLLNPTVRGWLNYFCHFYRSALDYVCFHIDSLLIGWVAHKYRKGKRRAMHWMALVRQQYPRLFAHWGFLSQASG